MNVPENSIVELKINIPRNIPLLTITDNFGCARIDLSDTLNKLKPCKENDLLLKGESWFVLEDIPKIEQMDIPQIKLKIDYERVKKNNFFYYNILIFIFLFFYFSILLISTYFLLFLL